MTLTLVLENSPHQQEMRSHILQEGELVIGRADEADWKIDDPEKYVSRRHCVISSRDGVFTVTDSSSGGLFIDGADTPLGAGNTRTLEHDMRLRMGDFVFRVVLENTRPETPKTQNSTPPPNTVGFDDDDFFSVDIPPVEQPERPDTLPELFEGSNSLGNPFDIGEKETPAPPQFDDEFTLDPVPTAPEITKETPENKAFFAEPAKPETDRPEPETVSRQNPPAPVAAPDQSDLVKAFVQGLGLPETMVSHANSPEQMRELGKRFRLLVDGVMHLLRTRAKEKQNVRVAQTIIGAQDVNPLKFLATTDDALDALIRPRGKGYLDPSEAIESAFRDLTDHQMRTWVALQTALRRMIDNFDPEAIEKEMQNTGLLEALLAGGKSAKLWQLYEERYQEIARAAEERFLGEVGADFRDAYEQKRRN